MAVPNPRVRELIAVQAQELQIIEFVLADLLIMKRLSNASGDQLDILGDYVGELRGGKNDPDYREAIRLKAFVNSSNGEPETIIRYALDLMSPSDMNFIELYPAAVLIQVITNNPVSLEIKEKLQKIAPAGVEIFLEFAQEGDVFGFDGEGGFPSAPFIAGFGEEGIGNELIGGRFTEVL